MKHARTAKKAHLILALSITAFLSSSCSKDDDDNGGQPNTIANVVSNTPDFSTLNAAIGRSTLGNTLAGAGPFTVFAPDNTAFTASGISQSVLNSLTPQQTTTILQYHTLPGSIASSAVPTGPNARVSTVSGDSVFVTRNANGVFVNGIRVTQADVAATNGVIHRIGRVLLPPAGNLVQSVTANTGASALVPLDSLNKAVGRVAAANPTLASALTTNIFTVFAPTNAAFTQLLQALGLTDINQIPINTLQSVLTLHVVPGRVFSSDLANGSVGTVNGANITVALTGGANGGPAVRGNGNGGSNANVTATNIMARNGVVHIIDRVLLP